MGVPVSPTRCLAPSALAALAVRVVGLLKRCASSSTRYSQALPCVGIHVPLFPQEGRNTWQRGVADKRNEQAGQGADRWSMRCATSIFNNDEN